MITEEQILELASSYLRELYSGDVGDVVWQPLQEDALLKFAQRVSEIAYDKGRCDGYSTGYDDSFYDYPHYCNPYMNTEVIEND
jgi:hypothetical protein